MSWHIAASPPAPREREKPKYLNGSKAEAVCWQSSADKFNLFIPAENSYWIVWSQWNCGASSHLWVNFDHWTWEFSSSFAITCLISLNYMFKMRWVSSYLIGSADYIMLIKFRIKSSLFCWFVKVAMRIQKIQEGNTLVGFLSLYFAEGKKKEENARDRWELWIIYNT